MNDIPIKFGVPNTLPPLNRCEIRGCLVFAAMGLFVLLLGLFPRLRPPPQMALPLALALPAWGLFRFLMRRRRGEVNLPAERTKGTSTQVGLYAVIMIGAGIAFYIWAKGLGLSSPVIFGSLLIIEGLGGLIVSMTEWWRLSHVGVSLGLMAGGFLLPFTGNVSVAVPVGGALLAGALLSAAILHLQLRHHEASHTNQSV